jgi:protein-disulfide isomerase
VKLTRRQFCEGAAAVALIGFVSADAALSTAWAQTPPAPSNDDLMAPGPLEDRVLGDANAPVTIIEYASMTCPHCANFETTTYPELKKRYIDTGKVRLIFREFPLDQLAAAGAMLARCADKDKFFPLIETLFQKQNEWVVQKPIEPLMNLAKQAGFTKESFEKCLSDQPLLDQIKAQRDRASDKLGVNSTPTFFVNGKLVRGEVTIEALEKEFEPYLKS